MFGEAGYEACDDGNDEPADRCLDDCTLARCGDRVVREDIDPGQPGHEACDDGNQDAGDGCSGTCQIEACGNGVVDPGEGCDDGDEVQQVLERLSSGSMGTVYYAPTCCPWSLVMRPVTTATSTVVTAVLRVCEGVCGNGILDPGEGCDDGNRDSDDGCLATV